MADTGCASGVESGGERSIAPQNGENPLFTVDLDGRGAQEGVFLWTFWTSRREVPPTGKIRPYFAKRRALPHNSGYKMLIFPTVSGIMDI
jgi:hypothetical protein